jgi:mRNA interferase RelE/StbE
MYKIEYVNGFKKELRQLQGRDLKKVVANILLLSKDPRPENSAILKGSSNTYRVRQGNYRIVYIIEDDVLVVLILRAANRKDGYRGL